MVAVPLPRSSESSEQRYEQPFYSGAPAGSASLPAPANGSSHSLKKQEDWTHWVAAGSVVAGGILMVSGHKRVGLTVAAVGTMVALIDEPQALEGWWKNLPGYLKGAEEILNKVEGYLDEASKQGHRLQSILHR